MSWAIPLFFLMYPWKYTTLNLPWEMAVTHDLWVSRGKKPFYHGKRTMCNRNYYVEELKHNGLLMRGISCCWTVCGFRLPDQLGECAPGSHLRQNWDKFVLINQKNVRFLSTADHAKCDLLVSTRAKTCPQRQIFKEAVVLPQTRTFYEQQTKNVYLGINLSINFKRP